MYAFNRPDLQNLLMFPSLPKNSAEYFNWQDSQTLNQTIG